MDKWKLSKQTCFLEPIRHLPVVGTASISPENSTVLRHQMSPNFALIWFVPAWNDPPVKKEKSQRHLRQNEKRNSMPNGKTHFVPGAVLGSTVNLIINDFASAFLCFLCARPPKRFWRRRASAVNSGSLRLVPAPHNSTYFNVTGNLR